MLITAGGGGGAYSDCCTKKVAGKQGKITTSGGSGAGPHPGAGGKNGKIGAFPPNDIFTGYPGAGAFGDGTTYTIEGWPDGDTDPKALPIGGSGGAWGFGAGGRDGISGGGGGGYSGGGAGTAYNGGGGGGSYLSDIAVKNIMKENGTTSDTKDGFVTYQFVTTSSDFK